MGEISLYNRAVSDFRAGKILMQNMDTDENLVDIVGYHLQQAVEKLLKFQIEMQGDTYPFTHDIAVLMDLVDSVPNWVKDHAETLMQYGVKTRYSSMRVASKATVLKLYDHLEKYIETSKPNETTDTLSSPKI
ncbi:MAG: HEPN domain-containing protein [Defluviitaleaceae bacterium]|nr:HEPN domain-containing protein [Defluviitaleaceae bacterium]